MKRALAIRLLALEIAPLVLGLALLYCYPLFLTPIFAVAALPVFASVGLSVRDGAVLMRGGTVCEKKKVLGFGLGSRSTRYLGFSYWPVL